MSSVTKPLTPKELLLHRGASPAAGGHDWVGERWMKGPGADPLDGRPKPRFCASCGVAEGTRAASRPCQSEEEAT